jgi:hypothetical protein
MLQNVTRSEKGDSDKSGRRADREAKRAAGSSLGDGRTTGRAAATSSSGLRAHAGAGVRLRALATGERSVEQHLGEAVVGESREADSRGHAAAGREWLNREDSVYGRQEPVAENPLREKRNVQVGQ